MYVYELTGDVTKVMRACGNDAIAAHAVNNESCRFPVMFWSVYCALLRPSMCPLPIAAARVDDLTLGAHHNRKLHERPTD